MPVVAPKYERRSTLDTFSTWLIASDGPQYKNFLENWFSTKLMKWEQVEANLGRSSRSYGRTR